MNILSSDNGNILSGWKRPEPLSQLNWIYDKFDDVVDMLDERSLLEISGGYNSDVSDLLTRMKRNIVKTFSGVPQHIQDNQFYNLTNLTANLHEALKIINYNYFKLTMLPDFYVSEHSAEWGNIAQLYPRTCILASRRLGKCFSPETEVLMYDGSIKAIEDINVGDQVMGPDSTPRNVLEIHSGVDDMYEIMQSKTINYIVNSRHILHFKEGTWDNSIRRNIKSNCRIVEMPTKEFHRKGDYWKSQRFGYRVNGWDLNSKKQPIDAYFLGLWIGGGSKYDHTITNIDKEIIDYLKYYSKRLGLGFRTLDKGKGHKITNSKLGERDFILSFLKKEGLLKNKFIPFNYMNGDRLQRLQLLAGIIDSDGTIAGRSKKAYSVSQKYKHLIEQMQQLCWSLGFNARICEQNKKLNYKNGERYKSYDLYISGNVWEIPVKINRKKIDKFDRVQDNNKSSLKTKKIGKGYYIGFECDGDHLFLLKDGTVVHNTYEFSNAWPIWKLYGYTKSTLLNPIDRKTKLRKQGLIITNKFELGRKILSDISKEIKNNNALHERLKPESKNDGSLGKEYIETKNGGEIHLRSASSSSRGLHPGWVVVDDYGDNNWIYSQQQRDKAIDFFYGDIMKTLERGSTINVVGCVHPDTIIITKSGLRKIGDLCPIPSYKNKGLYDCEIELLGKDGWTKSSHYWCNGLTKTKKIILKGGYNLECSLIHPLWKMNKNGIADWCQVKDLKIGDYVGIKLNQDTHGKEIDLTEYRNNYIFNKGQKYFNIPNFVNRDLAYLIGLYIADGNIDINGGRLTIVKKNKGIMDFVMSKPLGLDFKIHQEYKMRYNGKGLIDLLIHLGCHHHTAINKAIPKKIFESNKETIKWFLQGMFDGDGCCYVCKKNNSIQINYSSISKQLINELQNILMLFGVFSGVRKRNPAVSKLVKGRHNLYSLTITGYDSKVFLNKIGFRFSGKSDKVNSNILDILNPKKSIYRRIPYQRELIKKVRGEKPRRDRGLISKLPPFSSEEVLSKTINKDSLKVVCDWFVDNRAEGKNTNQLIKNVNDDLIYLPIKGIDDNENYTVDFHIPNGHSFITNCISSHNTPFHSSDLYAHIRENDGTFKYFEYPAVMPDGTVVAPHRWNMKELIDEYETNGPLIFSREILAVPISDGSTIFPWDMLNKAFVNMQDVRLVQNRDSFPIKFKHVSVGCDFARSANIGADATVFTVWGIDDFENYWLLYIWRKKGAHHNEQVAKLKEIERNFRPDEIVGESNGFQKVMLDIGREHGIKNITDFNTTGWNKKDLYEGLPSLAILFNQGRIRLPRGDQHSKEMTDLMCSEFNSITIKSDSGKLESAGEHDDIPMACWFAIKCISVNKNKQFNFTMV